MALRLARSLTSGRRPLQHVYNLAKEFWDWMHSDGHGVKMLYEQNNNDLLMYWIDT